MVLDLTRFTTYTNEQLASVIDAFADMFDDALECNLRLEVCANVLMYRAAVNEWNKRTPEQAPVWRDDIYSFDEWAYWMEDDAS
jgi:hypothetical protein